MKPTDVTAALQALYPCRRPVWLWGPPGVGKSDLGRLAANGLGVAYLDVRLLLHDPTDMKFPLVDLQAKTMEWINSIFPKDPNWRGIIALEELAQCAPLMQGAALQVTWDRKIGEYTLPEGAWIIALANRMEDRAGANRVITPLLNRFIHLDLEVSHDDWQVWALGANIASEIRSFLRFKPALLHVFEPTINARAFPSPRSWWMASEALPYAPLHLLHPIIAGCVGEGPAAEFVAFLQVYKSLPDVDAVLAAPTTHSVPKEPSVLYALSGAIVERCRKADAALLGAAAKYTARMSDEFSVLTVRDIAAMLDGQGKGKAAAFLGRPEIGAWLKTHRHLLLAGNGQ